MNPQQTRIAWIAAIAAGATALVGGVAYAVAKSTGTTTPPGTTPAPTTTLPPGITPNPGVFQTPPHADQSLTMTYLGQTGLSANAAAGQVLGVTVPPGLFVQAASVQAGAGAQAPPGGAPSYSPSQQALYGLGGTVSVTLSGQSGWLLISGIDATSKSVTTVIAIGNPSGSPTV